MSAPRSMPSWWPALAREAVEAAKGSEYVPPVLVEEEVSGV